MLRFIRVIFFVGVSFYAFNKIARFLGWQELTPEMLLPGFVIGGAAAFCDSILVGWWNGLKTPFNPQQVEHKTDKTPAKISFNALGLLIRGGVFLAFLLYVLYSLYSTGVIP